jgi:predicted ATPase
MHRWRFYHHFPTGPDAPVRSPRAGVRTPILSDDGHDLAAALATIDDMGGGPMLDSAIADAFPRTTLEVTSARGVFTLQLRMPGLRRPMEARELSDGTLRYLALTAALLTPRPPELLVLNEPETSLHASLIEPLSRLIAAAGERSQIITTTHSGALAALIADATGSTPIFLERHGGATIART